MKMGIKKAMVSVGLAMSMVLAGGTVAAPAANAALISCYPKQGLVLLVGGFRWVPGTSCYNTVTHKWQWKMSSSYGWV